MDPVERYFSPIGAGNVAAIHPQQGQSPITKFSYRQEDNMVVVPDVELMDEHDDDGRKAPFNKLRGKLFDNIFNVTKDCEKRGAYMQIIVGHTKTGEHESDRPVVGHVRNIKVKKGYKGDRVIVGDMYFEKSFFEHSVMANQYPRRSPEISTIDLRMDPVALLGATSPARPLPDMMFRKQGEVQMYDKAGSPSLVDAKRNQDIETQRRLSARGRALKETSHG